MNRLNGIKSFKKFVFGNELDEQTIHIYEEPKVESCCLMSAEQ